MKLAILLWLISQPVSPYDSDESNRNRFARLDNIATAIESIAGENTGLAAFLLVDAKHESAFRRDVQECRCPVGQCDWDKRTKTHRARGLVQLHSAPEHPEVWASVCGTSVESQTIAFRWLSRYYRASSLECSYAALGGRGVSCGAEWARKRARDARRLAREL